MRFPAKPPSESSQGVDDDWLASCEIRIRSTLPWVMSARGAASRRKRQKGEVAVVHLRWRELNP